MNTGTNRSTDEAEIRNLVESWARQSAPRISMAFWPTTPGDLDVRRPASGSIEGN